MRRRAAMLALLVWLAVAGCGDLLEVQYDPIGDVRPSTLVRRLQQDAANFKSTWEPQRKGGYGPVDYQLGELTKAANAMVQDLQTKGGRFTAELEKAQAAGFAIVQQLGGRTSKSVQESWRPLRETLNTLLTEYRGKPAEAVYAREATPTQALSPVKAQPEDDYDKSFEIEQVQNRFGSVMKSWEGSTARRAASSWAKALDAALAGFSTGLGELARVKSGKKAEVVPAATRLITRADQVGIIVRDHTKELPPQLVEEWTIATGWLTGLKE